MSTYEAVLEQAEQLTLAEREQLARELISSLAAPLDDRLPGKDVSEAQWKAAWGAEIERRLGAYERGEVSAVPWRESLRQLREDLVAGSQANP